MFNCASLVLSITMNKDFFKSTNKEADLTNSISPKQPEQSGLCDSFEGGATNHGVGAFPHDASKAQLHGDLLGQIPQVPVIGVHCGGETGAKTEE